MRRGLSVSEYGVLDVESGETFQAADEEAVYEHLGYAWIPPELRENRGELEAARDGGLPQLVELADLQGDLHMHTDWSDGRATLERWCWRRRSAGTATSPSATARRLRGRRLERQTEAIAALNGARDPARRHRGDIRADGSLDMDDESLAARDWVMASIHSGFDGPRERLTERLVAAMENPHVDCIGHPTGRKINRRPRTSSTSSASARPPGDGHVPRDQRAARPARPHRHARPRSRRGRRAHRRLDRRAPHPRARQPRAGVAQARRGWLTAEQVVNTRTWAQVKKLMKR